MKKIFVRKVFEYNPTFGGKYSKYDGYTIIGLQKDSPSIANQKGVIITPKTVNRIISSPLKRAVESAEVYKRKLKLQRVEILDELAEIKFDLRNLLTKKEYENFGSNLVRKRFIEHFIEDSLAEKRDEIKYRVIKLVGKLQKPKSGNYLLISHSFFMKILKTYLNYKSLFENPEKLRKYFNYRHKTFEFGSGFELNPTDTIGSFGG